MWLNGEGRYLVRPALPPQQEIGVRTIHGGGESE